MKIKKRKLNSITKKTLVLLVLTCISLMSVNFGSFKNIGSVLAINENNTKLVFQANNNDISVDETNTNELIYKIGTTTVGRVKVKIEGNYLTPTINNSRGEFQLPKYVDESYQVDVEVTSEDGYNRQPSYFYQGESDYFPGDGDLHLDITANNIHTIDFSFEETNNPGPNPNPGPGPEEQIPVYPIVAYFEGNEIGVTMDQNGSILIPDNWTNGRVTFKAKICTVNGVIAPDDGFNQPDNGSQQEVIARVEGIANSNQINRTVVGSNDRSYVTINEDFNNYGKATIHITSTEEGGPINTIINIVTADLVNIRASAPLDMSYSVGSSAVDQAIITQNVVKDVSIFFGNTETTLVASGPNVYKITAINDNGNEVTLNEDGSATIELPDLSTETTTQVKVTILLRDGNSITRTVNIKRTAIILEYDDRENKVRAGYVMNKAYLYNNQNHSDDIFDAYLQVILYKDNVVAGYKQIKIDDEGTVNRLRNNEAWSIETFDENPIIIYDGSIEGINKASVFLTNGPISFESDTLPSVEFGIGSGVTVDFGGEG